MGGRDSDGSVAGVLVEVGVAVVGAAVAVAALRAVKRRRRRGDEEEEDDSLLQGQVIMVTGGNTGIGKAAAEALAGKGATVVLACRRLSKGREASTHIMAARQQQAGRRKVVGPGSVEVFPLELELADLQSVRAFALAYRQTGRPLHALVNNAGAQFSTREVVEVGQQVEVEKTMAVNHVGPWLLTQLLLPVLQDSGRASGRASRVVFVSSRLEKGGAPLLQAWLQDPTLRTTTTTTAGGGGEGSVRRWSVFGSYAASKLANLLTVTQLRQQQGQQGHDDQPEGQWVSFWACTPGMVNTELGRWAPLPLLWLTWPLRQLLLPPPSTGARPIVHLVSGQHHQPLPADPTSTTTVAGPGWYWGMVRGGDGSVQTVECSPQATDPALAHQLWQATAKLARAFLE